MQDRGSELELSKKIVPYRAVFMVLENSIRLLGRKAINGLYILCAHLSYGGIIGMETPTPSEREGMSLGHEIRALFCCLFKLHGVQLPAKYICLKS